MSKIVGAIADGIVGLAGQVVSLTDTIMTHKNERLAHDATDGRIHPKDGGDYIMEGVTYDKIAQAVNERWPNASEEEKTEYYNAIKSGVESAKIFLQHCKEQDIQVRVLQLNASGEVLGNVTVDGVEQQQKSDVYYNTFAEFYEKGKDLYKQATNLKYIGSIVNIRNTSNDNGNALDVSVAMKTSNAKTLTDSKVYDGSGNNFAVYNKESFTKFLPASRYAYKTRSVMNILSSYQMHPDWAEKKAAILEKLRKLLNLKTTDEILMSGDTLRCISTNEPLDYEGILDFESFKERACGVDASTDMKYPGDIATLFDTFLKLSTVSKSTPYVFTIYGIFLLDKTVNANINAQLDPVLEAEEQQEGITVEDKELIYEVASVTETQVIDTIEDELNENPGGHTRFLRNMAEAYTRLRIPIVVKNGLFVRVHEDGKPLAKGEKLQVLRNGVVKPK